MPRYGTARESLLADAQRWAQQTPERERYTKALRDNTAEIDRNVAAEGELGSAQQRLVSNVNELTASIERQTQVQAAARAEAAAVSAENQAAAASYSEMAVAAERAGAAQRVSRGLGTYERQGTMLLPQELQAYQRLQQTYGRYGGPLRPTGGAGPLALPEHTGAGFIGQQAGPPTIAGTSNREGPQPARYLTEQQQKTERLAATEARLVEQDRIANAELQSMGQGYRNAAIQMAALSDAEMRHGALTTEWIQSLMRGETTLGDLGNQMLLTISKFGGWVAAAGLVYGVFKVFEQMRTGAKDASDAVANLSRFNIGDFNAGKAQASLRDIASESNTSIKEVGQAAGQFATIFKNQSDVMESARAAVIATKLDNISLADSYTGLTAAVIGFHEQAQGGAAVNQMLNEMNALQRLGGARIKDVLTGTGRAAGDYQLAGGSRQYLEALIATMSRTGGISGTSAATAIARSATRFIHTPTNEAQLAAFGIDPNQGYDKIISQATRVAQRVSPRQRIDLATALGGPLQGSRAFAPLLNNVDYFNRQLDIVQHKSSDAATHTELERMLKGLGQEAHSVGVEFQNLGSEVGQIGLGAPLSAVLQTINGMTTATRTLVGGFNAMPGPLRTVLEVMLAIAATQKLLGRFGVGPEGSRDFRSTTKGLRGGIQEMNREVYGQSRRVTVAQQQYSLAGTRRREFETAPHYGDIRQRVEVMTQEQKQALFTAATTRELTTVEAENLGYLRMRTRLMADEMAAEEALAAQERMLTFKQAERGVMREQLQSARQARTPAERRQWVQTYQRGGGFTPESTNRPVDQASAALGARTAAMAGEMQAREQEVEKTVNSVGRMGQRMQGWAGKLNSLGMTGRLAGTSLRGVGSVAERVGTQAATEAQEMGRFARSWKSLEEGLNGMIGPLDVLLAGLFIGVPAFKSFVNKWKKASDQEINAPLNAPTDTALAQQSAAAHGAYGGVMVDLNANQIQSQIANDVKLYQQGQITRAQMMQRLGVALKDMSVSQNLTANDVSQLRASVAQAGSATRDPSGGAGLASLQNIQTYTNMLPKAGKSGQVNDKIQAYVKQYEDILKALGPGGPTGQYAIQQLGQIGSALFLQSQPTNVGGQGQDPTRFYAFLQQEPQAIKSAIDQHLQLHVALAQNAQQLQAAYAQANAGYGSGDQWMAGVKQTVVAAQAGHQNLLVQAQTNLQRAQSALAADPFNRQKQGAVKTAQDGLTAASQALDGDAQMLQALAQAGAESKLDTKARQIQNWENYVDQLTQRLQSATSVFSAMNPSNQAGIDDRTISDAAQAMHAAQQHLPANDPKRQAAVAAYYQAVNTSVENQLQTIQQQGQLSQAQAAATGDPVAQARAAQQTAQNAYNYAAQNRGRLKPGEWEQIVATLIQAQTATADAIQQQSQDTINANEQMAQARDYNNPQAQAADAMNAARQILGIARNAKERQAAMVLIAQAQSQQDQAAAQLVQSRFTLAESQTTDPLQQDALKYRAALAAVKGTGGSNRNQALATANQALQQWQQDKVNQREQNIQFQLQMGQITTDQAVQDYQALLHMRGLTKQMRQQIELQINQWQSGNAGGFDLRVGQNIKLPSLYDVRRAVTAARAPDSGTLNQFETNVNLSITNNGDTAYNNTIRALESALNTSIRSQLRAAGVRRRGRR